jgi:F420-dependent oxidoreductase-like protein
MRVCLMVEGQEGVTWDEWVALARAAEEHGLDGLFRSDHYGSLLGGEAGGGSLDAWTTLAALATVTTAIRLGSLVSPVTFRHPSQLAKIVTTVDQISRGRVELGLGAGWNEPEHRAYGFAFGTMKERLANFAEQLELIHRQWTEPSLTFDGAAYATQGLTALPRPLQRPHPPIIVGGKGTAGTVTPAVHWADEYNTTYATPEECAGLRRTLDAACKKAGRDESTLALSLMSGCAIGRTRQDADERLARVAALSGTTAHELTAAHGSRSFFGTVEELRERLDHLEASGVRRVYLQHLDHRDLDAVALMGKLTR